MDEGLWNEGDSMIMELKATPWLGSGKDGDATTPGAGNDGESTIIPGICMGRFSFALCDGPPNLDVFVGTLIGVPPSEGSFGEDLSIVVSGVARLDLGDDGVPGVDEGATRDILNCETLDVLGGGVADALVVEGPGDACASVRVTASGLSSVVDTFEVQSGPTFATFPFFSISSNSLASGSISSSLSPSSPPTRFPFSSFPNRTAAFSSDDREAGSTEPPRD